MRWFMSLVPLLGGAVGCWSLEHSEHGEHESKASWIFTEEDTPGSPAPPIFESTR